MISIFKFDMMAGLKYALYTSFRVTGLIFLLASCHTNKEMKDAGTAGASALSEISFGNGGGYSGLDNYQTIQPNGNLYKASSKEKPRLMGNVSQVAWADYEKQAMELVNSEETPRIQPGRVYYFLKFKINNKTTTTKWIDQQSDYEQKAQALYNQLKELKTSAESVNPKL